MRVCPTDAVGWVEWKRSRQAPSSSRGCGGRGERGERAGSWVAARITSAEQLEMVQLVKVASEKDAMYASPPRLRLWKDPITMQLEMMQSVTRKAFQPVKSSILPTWVDLESV